MTTYTDIVNFVKALARVNGTDLDGVLPYMINEAYQRMYNRNPNGWPSMRSTSSFTTTSARDYSLPANFHSLVDESVRYYLTGETGPYQTLNIETDPDAEIWERFSAVLAPTACCVISGADGTRRLLRLLPAFTQTGATIAYAYYRKPNQNMTSTTILDVPELASAVAWDVLASNKDFFRDTNTGTAGYIERRDDAYRTALRTTL